MKAGLPLLTGTLINSSYYPGTITLPIVWKVTEDGNPQTIGIKGTSAEGERQLHGAREKVHGGKPAAKRSGW